ncbi:Fosmidomycin resistance protein [Flavobacterium psychrophilum]|uniref:Major facilitator superfamily (MFS) permease. Fosmidomycin resistance protein n=1 Tax=Flavobacterium psychrophilum (strain ATCC 49511 / DSM 21280 / CIP 103535 / JIP02/86) TaxID=402612 RepID=A6GX55_FLAPJ|nr:Fosmidomycin resistance protein [Flavobacterium psychrophilum]AIN71965.1 Fosmidomycin resistance protein [Flavobacterium psychrophilum FPG101]AIN73824.1 Fosmidomycin resistance protein [Flavobacterium psychrophilum FPG3]OXB15028.1 MFS transporter [Flavobacterium psychrophilum] [Flavobacterium psychrophilum DSM 3660 = ATCC 49418]CAL42678.1 Major facilitator superfamily (MFS) permease. Fosmidomycin resistance protein [Flavobacterium psychrophilum JIP02/86]
MATESVILENKSNLVQKTIFSILFSISFAHLLNDLIQAIIPSIYPILKQNYGLTFTQIGLITFSFQLTASIFQPFVGYYTDKYPKPFSQVYGMIFSSLGIISISYANNLPWIIVSVMLIGLGSAIFHPESARISNMASGGKRGLAQSIFQVGGNLGTAIAPLLVAAIVVPNSQKYILWFLVTSSLGLIIISKIAFWYQDNLKLKLHKKQLFIAQHDLPEQKVKIAIAILLFVIFTKFFYSASLSTYYQFFIIEKFNLTIKQAQYHMFLYLIAYALGTILGGPLGDKFGRKYIIWFSVFGATPFALLLPYANLFYTDILMIIIGIIISSAFPAIIVYAQELLPKKLGMVSGLFYGFAFGMGALGSALLGILADHTSITFVYQLCSYLPILGIICYFLPNINKKKV